MASARQIMLTRTAARLWWLPLAPLGLLTDRDSRWRWMLMPVIVIVTALASSAGKLAIRRPRPGSPHRVAPWGNFGAAGFPSTHSACAFAIAGWLRGSRWGRWLHAVAVLIGYSRVHRRAHHAGDVVAGAALGYGIAWQVEGVWSRLLIPCWGARGSVIKGTGFHTSCAAYALRSPSVQHYTEDPKAPSSPAPERR